MADLFYKVRNFISDHRIAAINGVMIFLFSLIIIRLFNLQILHGQDYQNNYELRVEKTEVIDAARGNIYDRNGVLLAYNKLAYAVTIEDDGTYDTTADKNKALSKELYKIITNLEKNGDEIDNDFGIILNSSGEYEFTSSGTSLQRFRADVFGQSQISGLSYNSTLGINEADASADQIMDYLCSDERFDIPKKYDKEMRYKICVVRYNMNKNYYQKYIGTVIASDVSQETVAYIKENQNDLQGVDIEEKSVRQYNNSEAMSGLLGYTGTISTDEYNELSKNDDSYSLSDTIGKSGIEQYMDKYLRGTKGEQTIYVDSVGNLIETTDLKEPVSGNDVYLSIDANVQAKTYHLLEKEIAGILLKHLVNSKEAAEVARASDIQIPIYDVYFALINNALIDINHFTEPDASDIEKQVYSAFSDKKDSVAAEIDSQLGSDAYVYNTLSEEYQDYSTFIVKQLKSNEVLLSDSIDPDDEIQQKWSNEECSLNEYLTYCIEQDWMDISKFTEQSKYVDTDELYANLKDYILQEVITINNFDRLVYKSAIQEDLISGNQLCAILYDQHVLTDEEGSGIRDSLADSSTSSYDFLENCIANLTITPGQLGLEPCSGSTVVMDVNTGELLACVSYPGFDSAKLSNAKDSSYYAYLNTSKSNPLYNNATQQRTAPGSTFKMCTSMAGLSENVISTGSTIDCLGIYEKVSNHPKCWVYPGSHGTINVSEAIRDSCNYFFYEVGFRLAGSGSYNDAQGIEKIQQYASSLGLDAKTGVEIEENQSSLATEYPVMAAIGQSDNNITTIALARYCTAITNSGTVYDLTLLDHVQDTKGNIIEEYNPTVKNSVDSIGTNEWSAIHSGMRMVAEDLDSFNDFAIEVAGKTGTAEINNHPNHALFVGYAPYSNPQIALATRIAYGYSSHNASDVSRYIFGVYFNDQESLEIADSPGAMTGVSSGGAVTD